MSHYRKITVEDVEYEWVFAPTSDKIKIKGLGTFRTRLFMRDMNDLNVKPSDVEGLIRSLLRIEREKAPEREPRIDPGPRTRGFMKLIDVRIADVKVDAINEVKLYDDVGTEYIIEAEMGPLNIPVITLRKGDATKE